MFPFHHKKLITWIFLTVSFLAMTTAHALIMPIKGKPGKFREYPDRYRGASTGHVKGSYMECNDLCSRNDGLCREYNRDRDIREQKAKLKYPKKPGKMTLLEMAGMKPMKKVPEEDCNGHMRRCRTVCEKKK